jgi:CubicO group peptidase (beta-lactamase class C family)
VNGGIVWAEGFGFANVERRTQVTPVTRFRLGSVSKTLTAAGVALLYERGRIDLDASVQRYVPLYPRKPWPVTTRQLMGDIAGVHVIRVDNNDQVPHFDCARMDEALKFFASEPLLFEPGTNYRFSTNGWILLSAVVEAAAAEPFPTFMTREVLAPLGMESTILEATRSSGSVRVGDVDARTVEGGHHRASPDTPSPRIGDLHGFRAGLEGGARPTERRARSNGGAPRHSHGRHRGAADVPGSPTDHCCRI